MSSHPYPMQSAATCHPKRCYLTFALLHRPQADLHLCTVCLHPLSPCHLAHVSPVGVGIYPNQYFQTITIAAVSSSQ